MDGSVVNVQQVRLTKAPLNKVSKGHISEMLISAVLLPPSLGTAGSLPSLWLFNAGPARPKHPDAEKLFPYQSGNTAPPPHPFYKKHDSSIPKKMQEGQPDSRI